MFTWTRVSGLIVLLYAVIAIVRGRITTGGDYERTTPWITRAEKPLQFWLMIVFLLAIAAVLIFNVFNF
jgi:hypothetical protein